MMKKTIIMCAFACAAILSAKDVSFNIEKAKIGDNRIPSWNQDFFGVKGGHGKCEIIAGSKAGTKAVKIIAPTRDTTFYAGTAYLVSVGDTLDITAKVKGKGFVVFGYYAYNIKGGFLSAAPGNTKAEKVTEDWKEVKIQIKILPARKGDLKRIRPIISARSKSEVVIEDVKIKIVSPSAK